MRIDPVAVIACLLVAYVGIVCLVMMKHDIEYDFFNAACLQLGGETLQSETTGKFICLKNSKEVQP